MTTTQYIIDKLPYSKPFLFVDNLFSVNENGVEGTYSFKRDEYFYEGHFAGHPVTPGVILTECMAQIGLVCLGIFLLKDLKESDVLVAFSESHVEFLKSVSPGETVRVISEKVYFRFNKLKCKVKMYNSDDELVCRGELSGMLINK